MSAALSVEQTTPLKNKVKEDYGQSPTTEKKQKTHRKLFVDNPVQLHHELSALSSSSSDVFVIKRCQTSEDGNMDEVTACLWDKEVPSEDERGQLIMVMNSFLDLYIYTVLNLCPISISQVVIFCTTLLPSLF